MIHVEPTGEPAWFDERVRRPGTRWLAEHPDRRPPSYWSECRGELAVAFFDRCGYSAQRLNTEGTVDHFVSIDEDRGLAYEWNNYRYAAGWINSSKQRLRSTDLLDPFQVQDEWFEMLLPSLREVSGEVGEISGEVGEPDGELREVSGEIGELDGEVREREREVREPAGEVGEPDGELREVSGEVREVSGEVGELDGEVREREREVREREREVREPAGEVGRPTGGGR